MKQVDRALGIARSLAIYHGIPGRQRQARRLYAGFVGAGDLAFDIGAHAGNRTRALVALGCRVVAVEPQPDFARLLRLLFGREPAVTVIEAVAGAATGEADLAVSRRTPTVTTMAEDWRAERSRDPGFAGVRWDEVLRVPVTTLDALIARFGRPAFVKIDVEGAEPAVLAGLSHAVRTVSFEYLPDAAAHAHACVARLLAIGPYRFTWCAGERFTLATREWLSGDRLLERLYGPDGPRVSGDVYARLPPG
jgi:FkbM family methyltransferase